MDNKEFLRSVKYRSNAEVTTEEILNNEFKKIDPSDNQKRILDQELSNNCFSEVENSEKSEDSSLSLATKHMGNTQKNPRRLNKHYQGFVFPKDYKSKNESAKHSFGFFKSLQESHYHLELQDVDDFKELARRVKDQEVDFIMHNEVEMTHYFLDNYTDSEWQKLLCDPDWKKWNNILKNKAVRDFESIAEDFEFTTLMQTAKDYPESFKRQGQALLDKKYIIGASKHNLERVLNFLNTN